MRRPTLSLIALSLIAVPAASCRLDVDFQRMRDHVVACDRAGQVYDPESGSVTQDRAAHFQHLLRRADSACDAHCAKRSSARPVRKILIHVHGGLNSKTTSLNAADSAIQRMLGETDRKDWHYPIFVTWDSGLLASYGKYVLHLRHGRQAKYWGPITAPIYFLSDLATAAIYLPRTAVFQVGSDLATSARSAFGWNLLPSWRNAAAIYDAIETEPKGQIRSKLGNYRRTGLQKLGRSAAYLLTLPIKLGTGLLIGEGIGRGSWDGMLHAASNMYRRYGEFDLPRPAPTGDEIRARQSAPPTGPFAELLRTINRHVQSQNRPYEITLVAHSMGAIIVNDALRELHDKRSTLNIRNVVYMAPACSIDDAAQSIVPYLLHNKQTEFHLLTLHPIAEADEINVVDLPPRGSLLEWIDNYYSRPTNPQERRLGKWNNIMQAQHLFHRVAARVTIKGFGVDGSCSKPQKHGEFNKCPFWKRSFWNPDGPMTW